MSEPMGDVGKRLAISGGKAESRTTVSLFDLDGHGGRKLLSDVMVRNADQLGNYLCAECVNCPRMEVKTDQFKDHKAMNMHVSARATCDMRGGECPDGFSVNERGWRSGVKTEEYSMYSDASMGSVVTGYEYSEVPLDPLTMNHLTISQRCRQFDDLTRAIHAHSIPGRVDQTAETTTIETPGRGVVKLHRRSGKLEVDRGATPMPAEMTIQWPTDRSRSSPEEFRREYQADFGNARTYVPARPKDLPSAPDAGTW